MHEYQAVARVGEEAPDGIRGARFGQVERIDGSLRQMCNYPDGNLFCRSLPLAMRRIYLPILSVVQKIVLKCISSVMVTNG